MKATKILTLVVLLLIPAIHVHAWPWPDTGQTKCYNNTVEITCPAPGQPFYGQDAQYQGPTRSYTKLGQNGAALSDSATQANGWVMTRDNVTGLIWEMKTDDNSLHNKDKTFAWCDRNPATNGGNQGGTCGSGTGIASTDAEAFIEAINDAHFGGFSDWRMPTIKELSSLVNSAFSYPGPTIDTAWFPNTAVWSSYWSSTTNAGYTYSAWSVYFYLGNFNYGRKAYSLPVRAVRGSGSDRAVLMDNGDDTVTDTRTGLMWQKTTAPGTYTWQHALAYAEALPLAGHTDWRLPNRNELQSLVDYSRVNPSIDPLLAPDTVSSYYWSSTTDALNTNTAWRVYFGDGGIGGGYRSSSYYVRAVRAGRPQIQVTPLILSFGYVKPGEYKDLILEVKNIGGGY